MGLIKKAREAVNNAIKQIVSYQEGKNQPIVTRYEHLNNNCTGGLLPGMVLVIAGISGSGKTHVLEELEGDIFNKELNSHCDDIILLKNPWEMTVMKLLLRKLKTGLNIKIRDILFKPHGTEEKALFKVVCDKERHNNIYYFEEPVDPKTWYENVREFLKQHEDKKQVVISVDHIALVRDIIGGKKKAMDDLLEFINILKKEFDNVSFILISQLNRNIEERTDVKNLAPIRSDIYNTDTLYHLADIVIIIHNPLRLGHQKYMTVNPDRYPYLEKYMINPANKNTNFETKNLMFWHYLKIRDIEDIEDLRDLYIEPMGKVKHKNNNNELPF